MALLCLYLMATPQHLATYGHSTSFAKQHAHVEPSSSARTRLFECFEFGLCIETKVTPNVSPFLVGVGRDYSAVNKTRTDVLMPAFDAYRTRLFVWPLQSSKIKSRSDHSLADTSSYSIIWHHVWSEYDQTPDLSYSGNHQSRIYQLDRILYGN